MLVAAGVVWVAGITAGSDGPPPGRSTGFVTVETDVHGVSWLQHRGRRFLSVGVNHVNNGGQDDGVGGRESRQCKHETGAAACGDTLSFSKLTHYAPYFNSTIDRWGSEQVRSYFLFFVPTVREIYGTFIARCNALIEQVSPCIGVGRQHDKPA
eukprot:SAG31_NODE_2277_length_6027_cov_4.019062_2_plen_154_part_00